MGAQTAILTHLTEYVVEHSTFDGTEYSIPRGIGIEIEFDGIVGRYSRYRRGVMVPIFSLVSLYLER